MVDGCVESNIDIDQIKITTDNDQIKVFAPNEYSLEKLYYIGSTKSEKDVRQIGAHGEVIKKVYSDLARIGIFNPVLLSGEQALIVTVGKEVPGTELRPLIYNYFQINKLKGNYFILNTKAEDSIDNKIIAVMPFINSGGDSSQDYFVDGLTEDLIIDLS